MKQENDIKKLVVISPFDGLSGAKIALSKLSSHINVLRYYSMEIDKHAIQIADKNYPEDSEYRLGDITKVNVDELLNEIRKDFGNADVLLIGGSPCQGFSMAGKLKGSSTVTNIDVTSLEQYMTLKDQGMEFNGQSYLFWEYIRLKEAIKPKHFILENVRVTKKWLPMFNEATGVAGKLINSNLLSAQDRPRYYWTSTEVSLPKDANIYLKDILQSIEITKQLSPYMCKEFNGVSRLKKGIFNFTERDKGVCQTTGSGHGCKYLILGNPNDAKAVRKLTPIEQERLQTLPDNYTEGVPTGKREHMIGNGMTIAVIEHILREVILSEGV